MQSPVDTEGEPIPLSREDLDFAYPGILCIQDPEERAPILSGLGSLYYALYEESKIIEDLERAISIHEEAVQLTSATHPQRAERLRRLIFALNEKIQQKGDATDIEMAIEICEKALAGREDVAGSDKLFLLSVHGNTLNSRFNLLGSLTDIEKAVLSLQKAVDLAPDDHPDKPIHLYSLGNALQTRFYHLGILTDIENAILNNQRAVDLTPDGHQEKPNRLTSLGNALEARFKRLELPEDIENAILNMQKAVDLTPDGHPDKPTCLYNLGTALGTRFNSLGILDDIENTILNMQKAVDHTPDGNPDKPRQLSNLGSALEARFERLGSLEDIKKAILNHEKAVDLTPDTHPDKAQQLFNLGTALQARFYRLGNLEDIENAIINNQKAVDLTPDGHPDNPARLCSLGNTLATRFHRLGSVVDIENAILNMQKAVDFTPEGHPDKPYYLSNLGNALRSRFYQLGGLTDIEDAILSHRKAVDLTPYSHPEKPGRLFNLGTALQIRFDRLGNLSDIQNAITNTQKAVDLTPDGHPEKPTRLSGLGTALQRRFFQLGNLSDIENTILSQQQVADLTPDVHPDKPARLCGLGNALELRFNRLGNPMDIENSILNLQKAVDLTPGSHPNKSRLLLILGNALSSRLQQSHNPEDLERMLNAYSRAARLPSGSPIDCFRAACSWAQSSNKHSRSSLSAYSRVIDLLPRIAWLGLPVIDQHALLADFGGIAREAVSAAIQSNELKTAVEWAEQGRSIVWQNMLGLRTPVDDLRTKHPQLADQLQDIARQMEISVPHEVSNTTSRGSQLAISWENTVKEIRKLPGFEGFLKAKTFRQLAPAAHEGPVVILNIDNSRSDALILMADDSDEKHVSIVNIPLPRFSYENGQKLCEKLTDLLKSYGLRDRGETRKTGRVVPGRGTDATFQNILRILWLDVVQPVISGLKYQARLEHLTRIWWCATGSLAFLPIHAAGIYGTELEVKLSDYVVSSYTPTLTAILDLSAPKVGDDFAILTVAQPSTPNATPIPKTEDEVKQVKILAGGLTVVSLKNEEATVERVLKEMRSADWIHMACHGKQETGEPMKSGLLLHDRILELSEIVRHSLPRADFAFLSACQTAAGDERIADESVHLAAGMFMAGYRSVIATMWSIKDDDAPQVAEDVYKRILKDGKPNRGNTAYALHNAVKRLRESGAGFMAWVPFIHLGR